MSIRDKGLKKEHKQMSSLVEKFNGYLFFSDYFYKFSFLGTFYITKQHKH